MYRGSVSVFKASSSAVAGAAASATYRPRRWPTTTLPAEIVAPRSPTNWLTKELSLFSSIAMAIRLAVAVAPQLQSDCNLLYEVGKSELTGQRGGLGELPGESFAGGLRRAGVHQQRGHLGRPPGHPTRGLDQRLDDRTSAGRLALSQPAPGHRQVRVGAVQPGASRRGVDARDQSVGLLQERTGPGHGRERAETPDQVRLPAAALTTFAALLEQGD